MGRCKKCKYHTDCSLFATTLEESGVMITDFIANQICEAVLIGDKEEGENYARRPLLKLQ